MERQPCPQCRYANKPGELCCNLCGAILPQATKPFAGSGGLPGSFIPEGIEALERGDVPEVREPEPELEPEPEAAPEPVVVELADEVELPPGGPSGVRRLRLAQQRVTQRLQRLASLQDDTVPVLKAQIEAEREEVRLNSELVEANKALSQRRNELEERERRVRQLRKAVAAVEYDLKRRGQELERAEQEAAQLEQTLEDYEAGNTPRVRELQTQCVRLEEKLALAITALLERESVIHWLVTDPPAPEATELEALEAQVAQLRESPLEALEANDLLHWFREGGADEL